jgi:4-oxalocrotonate tautomerase
MEIVMPLITVTFASARDQVVARTAIASEVAHLSSTILGKAPEVTAVIVQQAEAQDWFAGGRSLADAGLASFWLDIRVTEGTNTKDEKARFIAELFKTMGRLLGPLHQESYAHVHEVRGDAYGYGGQTQERRYIASRLAAPVKAAA